MVQFTSSEKRKNAWKFPEPEPAPLSGGKHATRYLEVEEEEPLSKRWKSSYSQTANQFNPLNEPSPLGLRLKKSPSLLELIQMKLYEESVNGGVLPCESPKVGNKRGAKAKDRDVASGSVDKLKASNFSALHLRIGKWEYVAKHEGDLMAKCYFLKHKLVWEVLDGSLKKKIEVLWADIAALKADCPDNGPGTLTIVLDRKPLFFDEVNPQPRKHTQWQATSDFTNGEASTHRQHYLRCPPGVLNRHYEKLIQCDARLNFLSQQQDAVFDSPYFATHVSGNDGLVCEDMLKTAHSTASEKHQPFFKENPKDFLENIAQALLSDVTTDSDEKTLMSRVDSFCSLLQASNSKGKCHPNDRQDGNDDSTLDRIPKGMKQTDTGSASTHDGNDMSTPARDLPTQGEDSGSSAQTDGNDGSNPDHNPKAEKEEGGMSRSDSFADLLHRLPRITSLPKFLFDISEDGEILNP